ncbi:hypothetical protein E1176_15380 [Fulvivirga sp. RKSG066]|uniref:hypothetical protein n=1 Tax=Fulvivirga aurantia TaxID=2529383 RepID=UPI0012BB6B4C|nr:hypothetical protein [Fulvivirga aurantia]MTI22413.1 hypothetical protein [Fulvivirga aurantia]
MDKKRVIKSLETISDELKLKVKKSYPDGFDGNLIRLMNAKKEPFFCIPLETEDTNYLIKVAVTKNSDGDYELDEDENEFGGDGVIGPDDYDDFDE